MTATETEPSSYTTGTWISAAARAAALALIEGEGTDTVVLPLAEGGEITLPIFSTRRGRRWVESRVIRSGARDALGELELVARVDLVDGSAGLAIEGGVGIGKVAVEGLPIPLGEAAINPGPREMIRRTLGPLRARGSLRVILSIPNGRALAARTLNSSFGIVGGLSILGTRSRVGPHDHAHRETILIALRRAWRLGVTEVRLVRSGGRLPPPAERILVGRHAEFAAAAAQRMGIKIASLDSGLEPLRRDPAGNLQKEPFFLAST